MFSLQSIDVPEELIPYCKVQKWISNISEDNTKRVIQKIIRFPFTQTYDGLSFLVHEICRFSSIRGKITQCLSQICHDIYFTGPEPMKQIHKLLLDAHLKMNSFHLLRYLFDMKMYTIQDILYVFKAYNQYKRDEMFLFYALFANEFAKVDQQLAFSFWLQISSQNCGAGLRFVIPNLNEFLKNDGKKMKELIDYGCEKGSIAYALKYDDYELLKQIELRPHFSPDGEVYPNKFEPCDFIDNTHFIEFAAFFGSIQCFKHLFLMNATHNNMSRYAIAGGNTEIIQISQKLIHQYSTSFLTAIEFFRDEVFDWLLMSEDLSDDIKYRCLFEAVQTNNVKAVILLCHICEDLNVPDKETGKTVLHFAAQIGFEPIIKYLIEKGANKYLTDLKGYLPKDYSLKKNIVELLDVETSTN